MTISLHSNYWCILVDLIRHNSMLRNVTNEMSQKYQLSLNNLEWYALKNH